MNTPKYCNVPHLFLVICISPPLICWLMETDHLMVVYLLIDNKYHKVDQWGKFWYRICRPFLLFLDPKISPFWWFLDPEMFWTIFMIYGSINCSFSMVSRSRNDTISLFNESRNILVILPNNASRPPERQPTGTLHACANTAVSGSRNRKNGPKYFWIH